jgi:hypothetical protein
VDNNVVALVVAVYHFIQSLHKRCLEPFLADWPMTKGLTRSISPHTLPVLSYLPAVVKAADKKTEPLVVMLAALAHHIAWGQTYSVQDFGPGFLEKYGWTELIGLRGPIASDRVACGFLLLGPHIEYPRHHHEAEEVYLPLTHRTLWQLGDQDWTCRTPGRPVYHEPWEPHAMRTDAVPLLALYLWRGGDLAQKSRLIP